MQLFGSCLSKTGPRNEGHIVLTNGVSLYDSTGVANALTADILRPTQKLSLDARYGYDVDGHKLNSVLHERVERLAQSALQTSQRGAVPVIQLHDPWHVTTGPLATRLSLQHKLTSVLQYVPMSKIVSNSARASPEQLKQILGSVVEHSYFFTGTTTKLRDTIEYLSLRDLQKQLGTLEGPVKKHYGAEEGTRLLRMLNHYVPSALGFTTAVQTGVYLRPRRSYDLVVRALAKNAGIFAQHFEKVQPSSISASALGPTTSAVPACPNCLRQNSSTEGMLTLLNPTKRFMAGIDLCGSCLLHSHSLLDAGSLMVPDALMKTERADGESGGLTLRESKPASRVFKPLSPHGSEYLVPPKNLVSGTLPNGFSYVILPNLMPSDKFAVYLQVNAGSVHEDDSQQGMAHMLEHMVFQGTEKFKNEEVMKRFYNTMGMSFGGDANAFTMFRQTVFSFSCPVGKTKADVLFGTPDEEKKPEGDGLTGGSEFEFTPQSSFPRGLSKWKDHAGNTMICTHDGQGKLTCLQEGSDVDPVDGQIAGASVNMFGTTGKIHPSGHEIEWDTGASWVHSGPRPPSTLSGSNMTAGTADRVLSRVQLLEKLQAMRTVHGPMLPSGAFATLNSLPRRTRSSGQESEDVSDDTSEVTEDEEGGQNHGLQAAAAGGLNTLLSLLGLAQLGGNDVVDTELAKTKTKGSALGKGKGKIDLSALLDQMGGMGGMGGMGAAKRDPELEAKIARLTALESAWKVEEDKKKKVELMSEIQDLMSDADVLEDLSGPPDGTGTSNVELVLDTLNQMVLHATLPEAGFNAERLAVLSEMSLRGGLAYEISKAQQAQLYPGSIINERAPIGKTEIINSWTVHDLKKFYKKWYYPGNMCAYVVGNVNPEKVHDIIKKVFGVEKPRHAVLQPFAAGGLNNRTWNSLLKGQSDPLAHGLPLYKDMPALAKDVYGDGTKAWIPEQTQQGWVLPKSEVVRHKELEHPPAQPELVNDILQPSHTPFMAYKDPLNNGFSMALQCRTPLTSVTSHHDIKLTLLDNILRSAWDGRQAHMISKTTNPPFHAMELEHARSTETNAGILAVVLAGRPSKWQESIKAGLAEVKRLYTHGITDDELQFYLKVLDKTYKDATDLKKKQFITSGPHEQLIDILMDNRGSRSVFTDLVTEAAVYNKVRKGVTLGDVNKRAKFLFGPLLTYRSEPKRSTAVAFCTVPEYYEYDEVLNAYEAGSADKLGAAGTDMNLMSIKRKTDAADSKAKLVESSVRKLRKINITEADIKKVLHNELAGEDPAPYKPLKTIPELMPAHIFSKPHGVSLKSKNLIEWCDSNLCKLSNGMAFNYKVMPGLENAASVTLSFGYGHAWTETVTDAPALALSVMLSSGTGDGKTFNHSVEAIQQYELLHGVRLGAKAGEKTLQLQGSVHTSDDGLKKLLHHMYMYWMHHSYDENMFQRARIMQLESMEAQERSIGSATLSAMYDAVFRGDPRFTSRKMEDILGMNGEHIKQTFQKFLSPSNAELTIIGDVGEPEELEKLVTGIFGHVPAQRWKNPPAPSTDFPLTCRGIFCAAAMSSVPPPKPKDPLEAATEALGASNVLFDKLNAGTAAVLRSAKAGKANEVTRTLSTRNSAGVHSPKDVVLPVSADGPVPDLGNLNVVARVDLKGDLARGNVFCMIPWPNSNGQLNISVGDQTYKTPMMGDGYSPSGPPQKGQDGQEAWSPADIVSHPRYVPRCLYILGQLLENRLFRDIRTKRGLCYSINFQSSMTSDYDMGWGMVQANSFTDDRRINTMMIEIANTMKGMLTDPPTEEEYQAAMVPILGQVGKNEGSLDTWIERLSNVQLPHSDKQIWLAAGLASYFKALTLDDVLAVMKQHYFPTPENLYFAVGRSLPQDGQTKEPKVLAADTGSGPTAGGGRATGGGGGAAAPHAGGATALVEGGHVPTVGRGTSSSTLLSKQRTSMNILNQKLSAGLSADPCQRFAPLQKNMPGYVNGVPAW